MQQSQQYVTGLKNTLYVSKYSGNTLDIHLWRVRWHYCGNCSRPRQQQMYQLLSEWLGWKLWRIAESDAQDARLISNWKKYIIFSMLKIIIFCELKINVFSVLKIIDFSTTWSKKHWKLELANEVKLIIFSMLKIVIFSSEYYNTATHSF